MRRLPLWPTIIVGLAVAAMIGLGIWQLGRAREKQAMLARYAAAATLPATAFPLVPLDDSLFFRRSSLFCLQVGGHEAIAGRSRGGVSGWRHLVSCRRGADGPGAIVDIGWSRDFDAKPDWAGGEVAGMIGPRPNHRSLIGGLFRASGPQEMLLVADRAAPGLEPSAFPSPAEIPNNHLAYAGQWFFFALVAAVIYLLAVRARARRKSGAPKE